jgi:aminopeptidase N
MHYAGGRLKRQGPGLSFFYFAPAAVLVAIPQASTDVPFVFNEVAADFQEVTVQGSLSYRIADPVKLSAVLDFTIEPGGEYRTDDPDLLSKRMVEVTQIFTRASLQSLALRDALVSADSLVEKILEKLKASELAALHGLEVLALSLQSLRPTPEMARALEAEAREALQQKADEALYDRRNAAVEQERRIKESELATELAVEEKQRQIREAQMAAEIALEEQRTALLAQRIENDRQEADARAYALETALNPLRTMDWRILTSINGAESSRMIATAFSVLAENAQKIGELNISPDLLKTLLEGKEGAR